MAAVDTDGEAERQAPLGRDPNRIEPKAFSKMPAERPAPIKGITGLTRPRKCVYPATEIVGGYEGKYRLRRRNYSTVEMWGEAPIPLKAR